jgi:hypothetical protein
MVHPILLELAFTKAELIHHPPGGLNRFFLPRHNSNQPPKRRDDGAEVKVQAIAYGCGGSMR